MKFTVTKKQNNAGNCFVCGVNNPGGLHFEFFETMEGPVVGVGVAGEYHQSYPDRVHGGVLCALLDETIGRAVQAIDPDLWAVTVELDVQFKRPVPYGEKIYVVGSVDPVPRRIFGGEGKIYLHDGSLAAIGKGRFMKVPLEKIGGPLEEVDVWENFPKAQDPTVIEF